MIKNFTIGEGAFAADGEWTADAGSQDNLYLLDKNGTVLAARESRALLGVGDNLFAEFGVAAAEQDALSRSLAVREDTMCFMQCGPVPVLVIRYLWRGNHTLLAAVPPAPLAKALRTPGAYAGVLFPDDLAFSPLSASRVMPPDETVFRLAQDWISPYRFLRAAVEESKPGTAHLMQFLKMRTLALARLCDVHALYYYSGISYVTVLNVNYPKLISALSAAMLFAYDIAKERTAHFTVERRGDENPYLVVSFYKDPETALSALEHLAAKGEMTLFESPFEKGLYHLHIPFCTPPMECMGLRSPIWMKKT